MQRVISNNDMNVAGEGSPVLDSVTQTFLHKAFQVLRSTDAIAITGSCIVALTLQNQHRSSFLPGDIDMFVKQNLRLDGQIFDRYFLESRILRPLLEQEDIHWEPQDIQLKQGLFPKLKQYRKTKLNIVQIIEICLFGRNDNSTVNRPKIQIIVVEDYSPILPKHSHPYLTTFERKIITSFDLDIVQGVYNPNNGNIEFARRSTKRNILKMEFWYICDSERPFDLRSVIQRIDKYITRGFVFKGFKHILFPGIKIEVSRFTLQNLKLLVPRPEINMEED
jgi:hypothetical protein